MFPFMLRVTKATLKHDKPPLNSLFNPQNLEKKDRPLYSLLSLQRLH